MAQIELNRFVRAIGEVCKDRVVEEKWVIAPSLRVGFQWLDRITRSGAPVVNARVKTLPSLALELASPEMTRQGLSYISGIRAEVLIDRIFAELKNKGEVYLTRLTQTPGLIQSIAGTIRDLRLAGLSLKELEPESFEVADKGGEIKAMLAEFEKLMKAEKLIDYADALKLAIERIRSDNDALPGDAILIMPGDMADDLRGLELLLWPAVPEDKRLVLTVDKPGEVEGEPTDLALLRFINDPAAAPPPRNDNTARMFRAIGEVNEVRETLRRIVENKIAFDEVEIIHTDYATYVPMIYELTSLIKPGDLDSLPVTFAEGIPIRYSRPGRALLGFVSWLREDYAQAILVRMIQDGLLKIDIPEHEQMSLSRLAANFRAAPIGNGRERYLPVIDDQVEALQKRIKGKEIDKEDVDPERSDRKLKNLKERIKALEVVRGLVCDLLDYSRPEQDQKQFLDSTLAFLDKYARSISQLDEYSLHALRRSIKDLAGCLEGGDIEGLDILDWLSELSHEDSVGGLGPRPGCLFVSPLHQGGHSGRRHTFIIGIDDTKFPGAGAQDPLLLDAERDKLSPELGTASARLSKRVIDFARLLARLRGNVTLSYCCKSLADDREMFPSPALLSGYRILSGDSEGSLDKMNAWLGHPASFAPAHPDRCIDPTEWWLMKMCGDERVKEPDKVMAASFPHLGRGIAARKARESDEFTEYDGYVPAAGAGCDPASPDGPVMSASRLEKLAQCPMEYFFQYILEIESPEEYIIDPNIWLDPMEKGGLLHEVFRQFMIELCKQDRLPDFERDMALLEKILEDGTEAMKIEKPPPSSLVFERAKTELKLMARIFLYEEQRHCEQHRPCYFEAAIGMRQDGDPTPLDALEPAKIKLPGGKIIQARGQIDRVDEVKGSDQKKFSIWDYKTGSAWKYRQDPPFWSGRCVQNAFYLALAQERLRQVHPGAAITSFGYFFPTCREHGERIEWPREQLEDGKQVLALLCEMISRGCFPFTNRVDDITYSDYTLAFGDADAASDNIERKLKRVKNKALDSFRELRGIEPEED